MSDNEPSPRKTPVVEGEVVDPPLSHSIMAYGEIGYIVRGKERTPGEMNPDNTFPNAYKTKKGDVWVYVPEEDMQKFLTDKGKCGREFTLRQALETVLSEPDTIKKVIAAITRES